MFSGKKLNIHHGHHHWLSEAAWCLGSSLPTYCSKMLHVVNMKWAPFQEFMYQIKYKKQVHLTDWWNSCKSPDVPEYEERPYTSYLIVRHIHVIHINMMWIFLLFRKISLSGDLLIQPCNIIQTVFHINKFPALWRLQLNLGAKWTFWNMLMSF